VTGTGRDIAVRAVAAGKPPQTPIADIMSPEVKYCYDSDNTDAVAKNMADIKLRRLPVLNHEKRLVGIAFSGPSSTAISASETPGISDCECSPPGSEMPDSARPVGQSPY
jgi:hypothetical protein